MSKIISGSFEGEKYSVSVHDDMWMFWEIFNKGLDRDPMIEIKKVVSEFFLEEEHPPTSRTVQQFILWTILDPKIKAQCETMEMFK
jgi:hypothetical protein